MTDRPGFCAKSALTHTDLGRLGKRRLTNSQKPLGLAHMRGPVAAVLGPACKAPAIKDKSKAAALMSDRAGKRKRVIDPAPTKLSAPAL